MTRIDRYRGSLLGLAIGDALGARQELGRSWPEGAWTDDTSLALCLAVSLIERGGFDPADQLDRYGRYIDEGYLNCLGRHCMAGGTTRAGVAAWRRTGRTTATASALANTNGALMRLAPVPLAYAGRSDLDARAFDAAQTTHNSAAACGSCMVLARAIDASLAGAPKDDVLSPPDMAGIPSFDRIARGAHRQRRPSPVSMEAIDTLEAALWAFDATDSFEAGLAKVLALGGDADTAGAVYGQLAGAHYGAEGIPGAWIARVCWGDYIVAVADRLLELNERLARRAA